jgi:hypothetical protein
MKIRKFKRFNFKIYTVLMLFSFMIFSCDENNEPEPIDEILPPILLDCGYFSQDRVLVNDPQRPIDYRIDCWARITGSLRIEPGVVIEFENHSGLLVDMDNNTFEINGTANEPVLLTGTSKQKGYWRGIFFTEAHNPNNIIEHTIIEYAGSQNLTNSSPIYEGSLALRGVSGTPPQSLTLDHVEIRNGGSIGLDFHAIRKNSSVSVSNLTITGNEDVPVKVSAEMAHIFDNTSSFSGNGADYINITKDYYEIKDQTVSWSKLDVPYLVDDRIHINEGGHLTLLEGIEILFKPSAFLQAAPSGNNHDLSLKILGTPSETVLLAAFNESNWGGIYFGFTQAENIIEHAIIKHAKGDFSVGNLQNSGAIYMHANPKILISNTLFQNIQNYALYAYTGASPNRPELPNLELDNNLFQNIGKGDPEMGHLGWGNGRDSHYPF